MNNNNSISIIGYGPKGRVDSFMDSLNDYLTVLSRHEQLKYYDIFKKKYNESNLDCFKKPDKLIYTPAIFFAKTYWGFSTSASKDMIFRSVFANLKNDIGDYSMPFYNRRELINALRQMNTPEKERDYPDILKSEIEYETIPLSNHYCFSKCTIWLFGKTLNETKNIWIRMVDHFDKCYGDCFHSSFLSENPYPISILHVNFFDKINYEEIKDHILGIEKNAYLNEKLLTLIHYEAEKSSSKMEQLENGIVFSFDENSNLMNSEDHLINELNSLLIAGYCDRPLNVLLKEKYCFRLPVTVCVLNCGLAVPCYSVYLFYGCFSKEKILEIIPTGPLYNIIDIFRIEKK